jgi:hypothetical protein
MLKPLDPDFFDSKKLITYPFRQLNSFKSTNVDRLPTIGWFAKKKIGVVLIIIFILFIIYFCFYKQQSTVVSIGCTNNGCYATPCIGPSCTADNCTGDGCHAGDCYGESCTGGTCEGVGCRGGNCYGIYCKVGKCVDPNCPNDKEQQGLCVPNCDWGRAYNIQQSSNDIAKKIKNSLPYNTQFNQNLCINPFTITEKLISDNKTVYNYDIKGAYYYYGGYNSLAEIKNKIKEGNVIDPVKGLVRRDDPIIETIPQLYKNYNCEWETIYNDKTIAAKYSNNYNKSVTNNVTSRDYTWSPLIVHDTANNQTVNQVVNLDSKGNETMCPKTLYSTGPHRFTNIQFNLDIEQLKNILGIQTLESRMSQVMTIQKMLLDGNYNGIKSYMGTIDFFQDTITINQMIENMSNLPTMMNLYEKIEQIRGTIMTSNCSVCNLPGSRILSNEILPTDIFGNISPCKERVYIYNKKVENYDPSATIDKSSTTYSINKMYFANNDVFSDYERQDFINLLNNVRNNHLMFYYDTDIQNKTMIYICFFCKKKAYLKLKNLITTNTLVNSDGINYSLANCVRPDDFNHYMYQRLNSNQNVYYQCLKCLKTTI